MAYPQQSDFNSAEPHSAWWRIRRANGVQVCASEGYRLVRYFQLFLHSRVINTGVVDWNRRIVTKAQITTEGKWGPITSRAAWGLMNAAHGPQDLLDQFRTSVDQSAVTPGVIRAALWLMLRFGTTPVENPSDIDVPNDAVMMPWAPRIAPRPSGYRDGDLAACADVAQLDAAASSSTQVATPDVAPTMTNTPTQQTDSTPTSDHQIPVIYEDVGAPPVSAEAAANPESLTTRMPWLPWAIGGVAVAAVGGGIWALSRARKAASRKSRRS